MAKRALFSVYHKDGIVEMAMKLIELGFEIVASGGTAKALAAAGVAVTSVEKMINEIYRKKIETALQSSVLAGNPDVVPALRVLPNILVESGVFCTGPMLKHRVVTLRPEIHGGLIFDRKDPAQVEELAKHLIPPFDIVVIDFYPAKKVIETSGATIDSVIELTDVGGPTMVLSAAKGGCIVVCRPEDRGPVLDELEETGDVSTENRQKLRARAYFEVAKYMGDLAMFHSLGKFDVVCGEEAFKLSSGENRPQKARYYKTTDADPLAVHQFEQVLGMDRSGCNVTDASRAARTVTQIASIFQQDDAAAARAHIIVGVKHGNACGAGVSLTDSVEAVVRAAEAIKMAAEGDPAAMMGGCYATNFFITEELAEQLCTVGMQEGDHQIFDNIVVPGIAQDAIPIFKRKSERCRILVNPRFAGRLCANLEPGFRRIPCRGGYMKQENPTFVFRKGVPNLEVWGNPIKDEQIWIDGFIAAAIGQTSNANNIVIVRGNQLLGLGCGQQSRDAAAELAIWRSTRLGRPVGEGIGYTNSFFPYEDGPQKLFDAGIRVMFGTRAGMRVKKIRKFVEDHGMIFVTVPDEEGRGFFGHVG